ncbi:MliC family protein [Stenotrophomonas sp. LGBM10]|uniref:MliC family protein n=1 Tax=Stenotrophomonas sp. LGBM10 TaxID=3390038 RepID=UPI00398B2A7A
MRASQGLLSLAIVLTLAACQPAPQAPADPADAAAGGTDAPPTTTGSADTRVYAFQCGDIAVQATYRGQESATVVAGERTFAMSSQPAASGAKYGDGEGNVFWTKGTTEGILTLKGEADRSCTGAGEEGATVPPPAAAAGTAFRATGNEPGWLAVVADGATPHLRVETDYGQRTFEIATPTQGKDGWSGKAADGTDIKLTFQRTVCQDDMSGHAFGATAMLTVGARQYHGCGDFAGAPALAARP